MAESVLAVIAVILMIIAIIASFLPVVPGPVLVWAVGMVFGALTNFTRVPILAAIIITGLMLVGSTTGWWMQAIGMKSQGGSCLGIIGALLGGLVGTFALPIPFLGTLVGMVLGTLIFEYARFGEVRKAVQSGGAAVQGYLLSIIVEVGISLLILIIFTVSLFLTG